ncbi:MAG: DUF3857 domain-containing protein [Verrucomicrobia bacterium]|nr:DUF3857 domain-containing protein [Verrucomicrobiota bacterium]
MQARPKTGSPTYASVILSLGRPSWLGSVATARSWARGGAPRGLPVVFGLALLLLLGGAAGSVPAEEAFLPPGARVVLLAGLPGDLESETRYRQQLQGWLDWLGQVSDRPVEVFAFWESPAELTLPKDLPVRVYPARRETVRGLAATLTASAAPLLAIVWGHGGWQGATPVFHVRGPRLTAADLRSIAAARPEASSRWVLLFRGSGQFARELAGPGRYLLASESETMFHSDPIGLDPLLDLARARPRSAFIEIAEALGRAVADWYESRHLARTEEPTLWAADHEPRRLVAAHNSAGLTAPADPAPRPPTAPESVATPPPGPAELPAAWRTVERVDPRQYPGVDAVVLRRETRLTLASAPALASEHAQWVQILTPEGKHLGDFDFTYSPPEEELQVLEAEVLTPAGELLRIAAEDIREGAEPARGDYRHARHKFLSLPGVVPGAILRVRYRSEWQRYPLPHVSLDVPLVGPLPVLTAALEVAVPKGSAFHFAFAGCAPSDPELAQTRYGSTYTWRFQNLAARSTDALVPPGHAPALLLSTFPDWAAFASWYERITRLSGESTPALEAQARELVRGAQTVEDQVRALYAYVAGLRYVAVPLGVNSVRPHAAAQVFANQFGDCKDKANLLNTLLRALGFEAHLVLVPRFAQAYEAVPGLAFNHALSRVRMAGATWWLDTTDDLCRFGLLPPGDAGRNVLVIDGLTARLTALPQPTAAEHRLIVRGTVRCGRAEDPAPASFQVTAHGYPDYALRTAARQAKDRHANLPLLATEFRLSSATFVQGRQESTPVAQLAEEFTWRAEGECLGLASQARAGRLIRAPFWLPLEWELALQPRTTPVLLNQGYPLTLEEEIEMQLTADAERVRVPAPVENRNPPLRWSVTWSSSAENRWRARLTAELVQAELSGDDLAQLQRQLRELWQRLSEGAIVQEEP